MTAVEALKHIKIAIEASPRNGYVAELHVQVIKYAHVLEELSGREFCEALDVGVSFGTEFLKMRKIAGRLSDAGLDVRKL